jgi:transposase
VVRYKIEIHALLMVLFPGCTRVFVDPTWPTALLVPQAISECTSLRADGRRDAEYVPTRTGAAPLRAINRASVSGVALAACSSSLRLLSDQLEHSQTNLSQLQHEVDQLLDQDPKAKGMLSVPECEPTTVAVLRAELGDLTRFT